MIEIPDTIDLTQSTLHNWQHPMVIPRDCLVDIGNRVRDSTSCTKTSLLCQPVLRNELLATVLMQGCVHLSSPIAKGCHHDLSDVGGRDHLTALIWTLRMMHAEVDRRQLFVCYTARYRFSFVATRIA
jgi:hypothetical protein